MIIKPSATIRQNYAEISNLCKETKEPVHLTVNGTGDLVVMEMDAFYRREAMLKMREELLMVEEERANGVEDISIEQSIQNIRNAIDGQKGCGHVG